MTGLTHICLSGRGIQHRTIHLDGDVVCHVRHGLSMGAKRSAITKAPTERSRLLNRPRRRSIESATNYSVQEAIKPGYREALGLLPLDILQYPDAPRDLRNRQHQPLRGHAHFRCLIGGCGHARRALKIGHSENLSDRFPGRRIEMDTPHVEETAPLGEEVNRPSIRRPAQLVVQILAFGDARLLSALYRHHIDVGHARFGDL